MKIKISGYEIIGKNGDFTVSRILLNKKNKGEYGTDQRYFGRLYQALNYIATCNISNSDISNIKELKSCIIKSYKEVVQNVEKEVS